MQNNLHLERLDKVHPLVAKRYLEATAEIERSFQMQLLVVSGFRSSEEQAAIYRKGRNYFTIK